MFDVDNIHSPVYMSAFIIAFHIVIRWVAKEKLISNLAPLALINKIVNIYYSLFSLAWLLVCVYEMTRLIQSKSLVLSFCHPQRLPEYVLYGYYMSKLHEGIMDLSIVTLRFGHDGTNAHFLVHHFSTPVLAFFFLISRSTHGLIFMLFNLIMHVAVYAFHAGLRSASLFSFIRTWQYVQLGGGFFFAIFSLVQKLVVEDCPSFNGTLSIYADLIPALLYLSYYVLFLDEIKQYERSKTKN